MTEGPIKQAKGGDLLVRRWLVVNGLAHLFLNPGPQPVCGVAAPNPDYPLFAEGDSVCPDCDRYWHKVWLVQVG